jgi:hypothetical protein
MSGGPKSAQRPLERPPDGEVKRFASQEDGGLLPGFDVQMRIPQEDAVEVKDYAVEVHQGSSLETCPRGMPSYTDASRNAFSTAFMRV